MNDTAQQKERGSATLDDLGRFPAYTVDDIRQSIEDHPPYGDYQGVAVGQALDEGLRQPVAQPPGRSGHEGGSAQRGASARKGS